MSRTIIIKNGHQETVLGSPEKIAHFIFPEIIDPFVVTHRERTTIIELSDIFSQNNELSEPDFINGYIDGHNIQISNCRESKDLRIDLPPFSSATIYLRGKVDDQPTVETYTISRRPFYIDIRKVFRPKQK